MLLEYISLWCKIMTVLTPIFLRFQIVHYLQQIRCRIMQAFILIYSINLPGPNLSVQPQLPAWAKAILSLSFFYLYCIFLFISSSSQSAIFFREMILDKSLFDFWSNPWIHKNILYTKFYGPTSLLVIILL